MAPIPIFVTWWQLAQGLYTAYLLGEFGTVYPKFALFPPVNFDNSLLRSLALPTMAYVGMLAAANMLLSAAPTACTFSIMAAGAVAAHHAARFIACGEEYMPLRWKGIGILLLAFAIGITDSNIAPGHILPIACGYAALAALFRAGCMDRCLHLVGGRGNTLHNHQHLLGTLILPFIFLISGEITTFFARMPLNFTKIKTWHVWGCFVTIGALPFVKNVVSNRLIRRTGQGPWRCLELVAVLLLFFIGSSSQPNTWQIWASTSFVVLGRLLVAIDVINNMSSNLLYSNSQSSEFGDPVGLDSPSTLQQTTTPFIQKEEAVDHEMT